MRRFGRIVAGSLVLVLVTGLVGLVPDAIVNEAAAKAAPVVPLPPCVEIDGRQTGACLDADWLSISSSGRLSSGATAGIVLSPKVPACNTWANRETWSPSTCYDRVSFSKFASCVYQTRAGSIQSVSCDRLWKDPNQKLKLSLASNITDGRTGSTSTKPYCGAGGAFNVYVYGGPANVPGAKWAERGPTALKCRITWDSPTADSLPGPTWVKFTGSISGTDKGQRRGRGVTAWIPVDGELANPGPDAAFEIEDLGDGRYRMNNTSTHELDQAMTHAWDLGGESSTAKSPTRTFDKPGSYTIKLTVTDTDGFDDTATKTQEVAAPALGASLALDTESGTGSVALDETFGVTLRVAATDGVGKITDITAADPFANATNLEVKSGPEVIDPFNLDPESHRDSTWRVKAVAPGRFTLRTTPAGTDAAGRAAITNEAEANGSVGGFTVEVIPPEDPTKLEPKTDGPRDENGQLIDPGFEPAEIPVTLRVSVPDNGVAITDVKPFQVIEGDGGIDVKAVRKSDGQWFDLVPQPLPFPVTWTVPVGAPIEDGEEGEPAEVPIERIDKGESVDLMITLTVTRPGNFDVASLMEAMTAPEVGESKVVRSRGSEIVPVIGDPVLAVEIHADVDQGRPPRIDEGDVAHFTGSVENLSLTDTIDLKPVRALSLGQGIVTGPVELTEDFPLPGVPGIFDPILKPGEEATFKIGIETTSFPGLDWENLVARESVVLDLAISGSVIDPDLVERDLDPEIDVILDAGNGKWTNGIRVEVEPKLNPQPLIEVSDILWALYGETAESVARAGANFFANIPTMLKAMPSLAGAIGGAYIDVQTASGKAALLQLQYAWTWAERQVEIVTGLPESDKQAMLDEIAADLATLYEEDVAPIRAAVDKGVESFFTGVLKYKGAADQAGRTGDVQALIEQTGDAVEVISEVIIEEVTGQAILSFLARAARSERVTLALAKAREKLNVEEVRKLEAATDEMRDAQVNPAVERTPRGLKDVAPGTPVSAVQAIRGWAIDRVSDANLRLLTGNGGKPIMVAIRSRADETLEWLQTKIGMTPKPVTVKPKNANLDDCKFLGYRCDIGYTADGTRSKGDLGSVAMREPLSRPEVIRRLNDAGAPPMTRDRVLQRHDQRWEEWYGAECPGTQAHCVVPEIPLPSKWTELMDKTPNVVVGDDGLRVRMGELDVPQRGTPPEMRDNFDTAGKPDIYDKRGLELREVRSADGGEYWEMWLEDHDGVMKRVSGDVDVVSVTTTNGRSLEPNSDFARSVALDLQHAIDAQHPWSSSLTNPKLRKKFLEPHLWNEDPLLRGEPLLIYVGGEARVGWFDPDKVATLIRGTDTDPLASMVWLKGGPNNLDAIAKRQIDLRQKLVDPLSQPTPQGHVKVETEVRTALRRANQAARVTKNAAEIQKTADRYATCAITVSRAPRAAAAVWRMSDRLQKRQADGTWVDAEPGADCDGGDIIVLPETAILTDILAGVTVLPIIEELLGFDWKDMFRVGDCITIDAGLPNEESACIVEHGSLVLDRPLKYAHSRYARVVLNVPLDGGGGGSGGGSGGNGGSGGSGGGTTGGGAGGNGGSTASPPLSTAPLGTTLAVGNKPAAANANAKGAANGRLATTGGNPMPIIWIGMGLMLAGAVLMARTRRRRASLT